MTIPSVRTVAEIRENVIAAHKEGKTTCVVPTMGGLHAGHLSLIEKASQVADYVVVTIFVNPTQFNNPDDFENYPSSETADMTALEKTKTDIVFAPSENEMYPKEFSTSVTVTAANGILCDAHRPGHFDGVATIVTKLFLQTGTNFACFGEKDFQQLFIIQRLAADLNIPIQIIPAETIREEDGLAMSSRNARLGSAERALAPQLNQAMTRAAQKILNGTPASKACREEVDLLQATGKFRVEYFETRSAETLELVETPNNPARLFAAAWLGEVRLIDNIPVHI